MRARSMVTASAIVPVAMALLVGGGSPAAASSVHLGLADVARSSGGTAAPSVTAACTVDGGAVTGPGVTFLLSGSATASGGVALATHVRCVLRTNLGSYGGPSGDLIGPYAAAAGPSAEVPFDRLGGVRVCAYGSAFFQGGLTVATTPSAYCA